jgi:peptidylprolyl isomerase
MRAFVTAALIATAAVTISAQSSPAPTTAPKKAATTTTGTHRPIARVPRTTVPADPKANEGVAAVGTMPAAPGTPAPLFTLKFIDLKVGDGEEARPTTPPSNIVFYTVHDTGWTTDGTKFDSSVDRGEPIVFPIGLKRVIAGWDTGFQGMRVGGKRRLIIPWQLAYGEAGHPPVIPAKADLIFDIELVGQGDKQEPTTGTHFTSAADAATPAPAKPAAQPDSNPARIPTGRPEEHQE